jgi:ubiquinone biosynthesis protein
MAISVDGWLRHRDRYRQIGHVLARHGFGFLAAEVGLRRYIPFARRAWQVNSDSGPTHLREALQELGATFIKAGQLLSTRADIVPPDYIEELSKLQDALPPLPVETIAGVVECELGRAPADLFAEFEPVPLAAASTSQVHAARLSGGEEVVVKVQRPGVAALFAADLEIIREMAFLAHERTGFGREYDLLGLADEMANALSPSLDYRNEARNIERFRANFAEEANIHLPRVYGEYSSERVLTMERLRGAKITDRAGLSEMGVDRHALAVTSAQVLLKTVFEDGFFHADPHPGNFFVLPGGRLGVMDFGLVGYLGATTREELIRLFIAVVGKDATRAVDALLRLGALNRPRERRALVRDVERLLDVYFDLPLGEIPLSQLFADTMRVARRRGLQLPTNLALLATVVAANEGMGRGLDPGFRMLEVAKPFAKRLLANAYSPAAVTRRIGEGVADALEAAPQLPVRLQTLLRELESGGVEISVRSEQVDRLGQRINAAANRLALSILAAAFIVGLAVLLLIFGSSGWTALVGVLFGVGFLAATALGVWLLLSIMRSE